MSDSIPDWLQQMDAQRGANNPAPQSDPQVIPDWLNRMDAARGASPESVTVTADRDADDSPVGDLAANVGTGLARIPGAIIGTPHVLAHTADWLFAKLKNMTDGGDRTGADIDQDNPLAKHTLSSEDVDNGVFKGISAVAGHEVKPYEPTSFIGRMLQAGITGAGAGLLDPDALLGVVKGAAPLASALEGAVPRMAKTALAADAANETANTFPDNPGLAAAAALLAHTGASGLESASRAGGAVGLDAARQIFKPTAQGKTEAGRMLANVDNTQPGIAVPSDADLASGTNGVREATEAIGPGQQPWQAGAELRSGLQSRTDALRAARSASAGESFDAFRAQPALPSDKLQLFMRSPSFRKAVGAANAAILDEGGEPLTDYWDFNEAGDPSLKSNAAVPPDVLGRVKSWLGSAAANAPSGSAEARTAGILDKRFGDFMEQQYPASDDFPGYAAVRQGYADAGRPLGDFAHGPVGKVLDTDRQYGQSTYKLADERVPDLFLRSKATRTDLNQLVSAHGGDRSAALGALQDHLEGVAQTAVRPDGTLDTAAFDKAMKPYKQSLGNMGVWFPELNQKFNTAKQAQGTLDTLNQQRGIADAVSGGALRDGDGVVTGASFGKWLRSNGDALAKTQSPNALMRLQSMAGALQGAGPGELADALKSELLPAALGAATGGLEGSVLTTLLHKSVKTAFGSLDAKRQAAFSTAIEQAVTDPAYATRLAAEAHRHRQGVSPARALVRAIVATPLAVNAGAPIQR